MAYDLTCAGALQAIKSATYDCKRYTDKSRVHNADVFTHHMLNQDHDAIYDLMAAVDDLITAVEYSCYSYAPFAAVGPFWWYLTNCIEAEDFTWDKIIESYLAAPDDLRSAWQLLTDAYKASMYDKPFDREYHSLWIQRFKSWV